MGRHKTKKEETPPTTSLPTGGVIADVPPEDEEAKKRAELQALKDARSAQGDDEPRVRRPRKPRVKEPDEAVQLEVEETAETFSGIIVKAANVVCERFLKEDALVEEEGLMLSAATKAYIRKSAAEDIAKLPGWALLGVALLIFAPRAYNAFEKAKARRPIPHPVPMAGLPDEAT